MKKILVCAFVITLLRAGGPAADAQVNSESSPVPLTIWDGVFTEGQAERGRQAYSAFCSSCHSEDLSGYDDLLRGARFMDRWREDSLESLFLSIRNTMPRGSPGSLGPETYLDILAYLLSANGLPAGPEDLEASALQSVRVIGSEGPATLPDGALVQVYGCLETLPDGTWILRDASGTHQESGSLQLRRSGGRQQSARRDRDAPPD